MLASFSNYLPEEMKSSLLRLIKSGSASIVYLSGAEIQQLMRPGLLKGVNGYGNPYTITYVADGVMRGVARKSNE